MREALGDGYVEALRGAWPEVPESSDFVMFWWHHAAGEVAAGRTRRMGLITTNSLTMVFNRRVVQAALDKGTHLEMAIPDHPWVDGANGAAVRIAMTVLAAGEGEGVLNHVISEQSGEHGEVSVTLRGATGLVHADLKVGANVAKASPLRANEAMSHMGVILVGAGFIVQPGDPLLQLEPGPIKPYMNGRDLTQTSRGVFVIDLAGLTLDEVRSKYPHCYQRLYDTVRVERAVSRDIYLRENWWLFRRTNLQLRSSLAGLNRYIGTTETAKHRTFSFIDGAVLPDQKIRVITLDDSLSLGVLSSSLHVQWALATGGTLEDRPVYNSSICFGTFPFPNEDTGLTPALRDRIAQLAEQIDAHRKRVLAPESGNTGLTLTGLYNVLAALREGRALTAKEKTQHTQGLVGVLRELHDELDAAVLAAYGLPATASTDDILAHLVQLNTQRAAEEAQGRVRWLRPAFQNPQNSLQKQELLPQDSQAPEADFDSEKSLSKPEQVKPTQHPWPPTLPEQVRAVADALAASPTPLTLSAIEARFKGRGPWKKSLPTLLQTLEALGRAQAVATDGEVAWRG